MPSQPIDFLAPWKSVPTIWIDFETTGTTPGVDAAVEVGLVRFEHGKPVGSHVTKLNPHRPIPKEATAVHNITDADVQDAPDIVDVFDAPDVRALIKDAQPSAYNSPFDRLFVPPGVFSHEWPWLDAMVLVAMTSGGRGRSQMRLERACERNGVTLDSAHSAAADSKAAGELFYQVGRGAFLADKCMGDVLARLETERAKSWHSFHTWLARKRQTAEAFSKFERELVVGLLQRTTPEPRYADTARDLLARLTDESEGT